MKKTILVTLCILAPICLFFSLLEGSTSISIQQLFAVLLTQIDHSHIKKLIHRQIILELRLPRTLAAFTAGGLLALSGSLIQVLLKNPLADPYVLGISGGAALASLFGILCGVTGYWLTGSAWLGSLAATLLVFLFARQNKHAYPHHLLLTGIALASGFSALISLILLIAPNTALRSMLFWLLGDLSYAHMPVLEFIILVLGFLLSFSLAKQLNILLQGEQHAEALGIHTKRLHIQLYFLSSLCTAAAVTLAGCIGFIGLIVPHMIRLLGIYDYRYLLPCSALLGGSLLTFADMCARTLLVPQQLPAGMMMVFIGIPIFLVLLRR